MKRKLIFSAPGRTEIGGNHTDHQHGCGGPSPTGQSSGPSIVPDGLLDSFRSGIEAVLCAGSCRVLTIR